MFFKHEGSTTIERVLKKNNQVEYIIYLWKWEAPVLQDDDIVWLCV